MTQKEKAKKDKVEKIKKSAFRFLHIIGYISTAFIVLLIIISCVKGCSSKRQNRSDSIISQPNQLINYSQNQIFYQFKFESDSSVTIPLNDQISLLNESPYNNFQYSQLSNNIYRYDFTYQIQEFNGSVLTDYDMYYVFVIHFDNDYYLIGAVDLVDSVNNETTRIIEKSNWSLSTGGNDFSYTTFYVESLFIDNSSYVFDSVFTYLFELNEGTNFTFNPTFNYNAPMGLNLAAQWGNGASFTHEYDVTAYIDYNVGLFVSNGQLYDFIRITYQKTTAMSFYINDKITSGPIGAWTYMFLGYGKSWDNNSWDIVNYRDMQNYEKSGAYGYYVLGTTTWRNDQYRYIKFLQPLSESNRIAINAFNNNNVGSYSGSINGNGNVFILLGSAFSELLPFLNIMILPNISIGVLLFLPLIVGIVVILFKILKK